MMRRLAESGVTAILKTDHERFAESGNGWTLVISGARLGEIGFVRAEAPTLAECLRAVLPRLAGVDEEWQWVLEYVPEP